MAAHSKTLKITKFAVLGAGLLAGAGLATYTAYARTPDGVIPNRVRVADMDWSNKPVETVREELRKWQQERLAETVTLNATLPSGKVKTWTPTRAELGAKVDVDSTVKEAEKAREDESAVTRMANLFSAPKPVELTPKWTFDVEITKKYLAKQVAPAVARIAKDARFLATNNGFKIVPEEPGVKLDVDGSIKLIQPALESSAPEPISLPLVTATPHVTTADLKGIEGEVGRYQTHYGETGNRARNIANACSRINGTVLKPGDIFSYNKIVGPRESSNGFRIAPVIIRGKLEPGLGGGVCQTSSTLYNAVLMSGLKVVRRTHHAFPVHYLPAGRDATVAYGSIDFQFQNDTETPIAVAADGTDGRVLMRIFGKKVPGRVIRIDRTSVSSWDPPVQTVTDQSLPAGKHRTEESGHAGHRVKVWRVVKVNGQLVKRELLSSDHYDAFPRVVAVGAGAAPAPKKPTPKSAGSSAPASAANPTILPNR